MVRPALHKASKHAQPPHIHPEDGNYNFSRNTELFSTFDAAQPRKQKLHVNINPFRVFEDEIC
jgi:hypothetical protein